MGVLLAPRILQFIGAYEVRFVHLIYFAPIVIIKKSQIFFHFDKFLLFFVDGRFLPARPFLNDFFKSHFFCFVQTLDDRSRYRSSRELRLDEFRPFFQRISALLSQKCWREQQLFLAVAKLPSRISGELAVEVTIDKISYVSLAHTHIFGDNGQRIERDLVLGWLSQTVPKPEDHLLGRFVRIWELEVTHKKYQKEMKMESKIDY